MPRINMFYFMKELELLFKKESMKCNNLTHGFEDWSSRNLSTSENYGKTIRTTCSEKYTKNYAGISIVNKLFVIFWIAESKDRRWKKFIWNISSSSWKESNSLSLSDALDIDHAVLWSFVTKLIIEIIIKFDINL